MVNEKPDEGAGIKASSDALVEISSADIIPTYNAKTQTLEVIAKGYIPDRFLSACFRLDNSKYTNSTPVKLSLAGESVSGIQPRLKPINVTFSIYIALSPDDYLYIRYFSASRKVESTLEILVKNITLRGVESTSVDDDKSKAPFSRCAIM